MSSRLGPAGVIFVLAAAGCGGGGSVGTVSELEDALMGAAPGDVIRLAEGTFTGSIQVPAGVTLEGSGPGTRFETRNDEPTILIDGEMVPDDAPGLVVVPATAGGPTTIRDMTIVVRGGFGIVARGEGAILIEDVRVEVQRGIGIGMERLTEATLTRVDVDGPVDPAATPSGPTEPTPYNSASHGLVFVGVMNAQLQDVRADQTEAFGTVSVDSTVSWQRGSAREILGTGILIHGGRATLEGLELCRELNGFRLMPAYGLVVTAGAVVDTRDLEVCDVDGTGVLHAGGAGHHVDLRAHDNHEGAIWLQDAPGVRIDGAATRIENNGLAGIVALRSPDLRVADATIATTTLAPRIVGETMMVLVGDGVQLVDSFTDIELSNLSLVDNARVGILADLCETRGMFGCTTMGSTDGITVSTVNVTGANSVYMGMPITAYGCVTQNGVEAAGWDSTVTRMGDAMTNDDAFTSVPIVEAVPAAEFPMEDRLRGAEGLELLGAVSPTP